MVHELRDRMLAGPGAERSLTCDELMDLARSVDLDALDLEGHRVFKKECYARKTIVLNEHFELAVICWLPGQASAVHDHGSSNCLYLIVEGEMQEERFQLGEDDEPVPTEIRSFSRGDITMAVGDEIHRIFNPSEENLVTIHIYSPPLGEAMRLFTPIPRAASDS